MQAEGSLLDAPRGIGFPLSFYYVGGLGGDFVLWGQLAANVALVLLLSSVSGFLCQASTRWFSS